MKKKKVTYGVYNLVEWYAILRMGKATVKVPFTGGAITTQGVTPATFTTSDPIVQIAIERSPDFARGKIKIVRSNPLGGEVEIERNKSQNDVMGGDGDQNAPKTHAPDSPVIGPHNDESDSPAEAKHEEDSPMTRMEFTCNDDAKDYLEQEFGFIRSKLHNREGDCSGRQIEGTRNTFCIKHDIHNPANRARCKGGT